MMETIGNFLGAERYSAHAVCLTNDPLMLVLYLAGHLGTATAYTVIGLTLVVHRVRLIHMSPGAVGLYGSFILLCALNHFSHAATLFWGIYYLEVVIVSLMMAVSLATAALTAAAVYGRPSNG